MAEIDIRTGVLFLLVALAVVAPPILGESDSILRTTLPVLTRASVMVFLALASALVIACGEIDLSLGGLLSFVALSLIGLSKIGLPPLLGYLVVLAVVLCVGAIQGWLIAYKGVSSLILTIGVSFLFLGIAILLDYGLQVAGEAQRREQLASMAVESRRIDLGDTRQPTEAEELAEKRPRERASTFARTLPQRWKVSIFVHPWVWLIFLLLGLLAWRYASLDGIRHLAVGLDSRAAEFAGINVRAVRLRAFIASAALVYLGGALWLVDYADGGLDARTGEGKELFAIAAAVLGGTSIRGGRLQIFNVLLATIALVSLFQIGIKFQRIPAEADNVATGLLVIAAGVLEISRRKRQ